MFEFPNPVNETSARLVAGGVVAVSAATIALDEPWLMFPLAYGFGARALNGPRFSPLGLIATKVITPRLDIEHKMVPGPPKRLAQAVGCAMSATAILLYYRFGRKKAAYGVLGALTVAASLESFFGYCIACRIFNLLMKAGLIPEEVCEECADIWSRYPEGHERRPVEVG
jgi:hypothetical protein